MRTFKLANECRPRSLLCVDARTLSFVNFTESSIKPPYGLQLLLIIAREQILKVGVIAKFFPIFILLHKVYCDFIS